MLSIVGYEFGGQYKTDDNVILEVDGTGNHRVRFRPTSAKDTQKQWNNFMPLHYF